MKWRKWRKTCRETPEKWRTKWRKAAQETSRRDRKPCGRGSWTPLPQGLRQRSRSVFDWRKVKPGNKPG
jgi:hypothetical protein